VSRVLAILAAVAATVFALWASLRRRERHRQVARILGRPSDDTGVDASGAVRSAQGADLAMPASAMEEIWNPMHLERLARTYWRFLTRVTLGLIRVEYSEDGRDIVLLRRPFTLLSFRAPEFEMNALRGIVRWRIDRGILVSGRGHGGDGYLQIDVCRIDDGRTPEGWEAVHVEVEVANFYPSISSGIANWVYANTQSRIHVIVCHAFLRSLARLDFEESRVGRYVERSLEDVPDPPPRPDLALAGANGSSRNGRR
jgi:hypothetical protein